MCNYKYLDYDYVNAVYLENAWCVNFLCNSQSMVVQGTFLICKMAGNL